LRFNAAINMCGTRNLSQSPQGEDGSESEYILQNEDEEFEEMYIPQVVSTSETEISSSNVESKDAGAANDKTPTASRKKSNRKTPMNLFKQGKLAVVILYYVILGRWPSLQTQIMLGKLMGTSSALRIGPAWP
jgi:hypothetical protein